MSNKEKSVIFFLAKIINLSITLLSITIVSRGLLVNDYANYRFIITGLNMIIAIISVGLPNSILYYLSGGMREKYLTNAYVAIILMVLAIIFLSNPLVFFISKMIKSDIFFSYKIYFMIMLILTFVNSTTENFYVAYNKSKLLSFSIVIPNLIYMASLSILYFLGLNINNILIVYIGRELFKSILFIIFVIKNKINYKVIDFTSVKDILVFGIPIGLSSIIGTLNLNLDKVIASNLLGKEAFVKITNATFEIPFVTFAAASLFTILTPVMKKHYDENKYDELLKVWNKAGRTMIPIIISITVATMFFSKSFIIFLYSRQYLDCLVYFVLYQFNTLNRIFVYGSIFLASGKNKIYTLNSVLSLLSNIILNFILGKLIGSLGIVLATVISTHLMVLLQNYQISKVLNVKIKDTFPIKDFVRAIVIATLINIPLFIVYYVFFFNNTVLGLGMLIISCGITFIYISIKVNDEILNYCINRAKNIVRAK
ncbi:polysaccharide biosynthesis C-terminal domain-containing protein [Clostridium sp. YIM B02515]|uniref:Polysaccharide biosynthesis C-terminal domain-containing protein n=1 Tax=Clostridium rhizosphaerae TaxID=2803861 RepID=A0ABS1TAG2_9CLOT|nr:polysaccharide biosynthesis C-terminal domain-containing protein [Clostridium rhizosphaerae]MBL4936332.1 polysaccharide biosynthesis C-terminal domain-containing protein [Clostridium rhizosphaerae]